MGATAAPIATGATVGHDVGRGAFRGPARSSTYPSAGLVENAPGPDSTTVPTATGASTALTATGASGAPTVTDVSTAPSVTGATTTPTATGATAGCKRLREEYERRAQ